MKRLLILILLLSVLTPALAQVDTITTKARFYLSLSGGGFLTAKPANVNLYSGAAPEYNNQSTGDARGLEFYLSAEMLTPKSNAGYIGTVGYSTWNVDSQGHYSMYNVMLGGVFHCQAIDVVSFDFKVQGGLALCVIPGGFQSAILSSYYRPMGQTGGGYVYSSTYTVGNYSTKSSIVPAFIFNIGLDIKWGISEKLSLVLGTGFNDATFSFTENTQATSLYSVDEGYDPRQGSYKNTSYYNPPLVSTVSSKENLYMQSFTGTLGLAYKFGK
jgi:hypothetical protein